LIKKTDPAKSQNWPKGPQMNFTFTDNSVSLPSRILNLQCPVAPGANSDIKLNRSCGLDHACREVVAWFNGCTNRIIKPTAGWGIHKPIGGTMLELIENILCLVAIIAMAIFAMHAL